MKHTKIEGENTPKNTIIVGTTGGTLVITLSSIHHLFFHDFSCSYTNRKVYILLLLLLIMDIKCHACQYEWFTKSEMFSVSCPRCATKVKITGRVGVVEKALPTSNSNIGDKDAK